jgi:hypothetical protein
MMLSLFQYSKLNRLSSIVASDTSLR